MKLLLYAGLLYLAGISLLILLQPSLVFREDGSWKEFGVGRDADHYTWMPFWLFAILWALLSYMIILLVASMNLLPGVQTIEEVNSEEMLGSLSPRMKNKVAAAMDQEGYYMLDAEATGKGAPKYVYLGPAPPSLVYNAGTN